MSHLSKQIESALEDPGQELVHRYFDPHGPFAADTFDTLGCNPPDRITASDLLAVTLLDMKVSPLAVRTLLDHQSTRINALLSAIPEDLDLWEASDSDLVPAYELWDALRARSPDGSRGPLHGMGPTTTSKLMARKRPRLIPIVDSVVRDALGLQGDSWVELRDALSDGALRRRIESIRPTHVDPRVSTLRLLDVLVWMRHRQGGAVVDHSDRRRWPSDAG